MIAVWGMAALAWVLLYTKPPVHDPLNVLIGAKEMRQYNFTSFIRGGIYGLCMALAAIYGQLKYFRDRRCRWIFFSAICISLAIQLKMNYVIAAVAMAGLIVYDTLLYCHWKKAIIYMAALVIGITGIRAGTDALVENITVITWRSIQKTNMTQPAPKKNR